MTRTSTLRLAGGVCVLLLTACAAIPLSTMWKMRNVTPETFFAGDPRAMRVAFLTADKFKRGAGLPQVSIDIDAPSTKPICYAFALDAIDFRAFGEAPLDPAEPHRYWSAFGLSRKGIEAFEGAKREVRIKELKSARFSLSVTFDDMFIPPDGAKSQPLRVDIALDRKDGYFTLIKETELRFTEPSATPPKPPDAAGAADPKVACVPAA